MIARADDFWLIVTAVPNYGDMNENQYTSVYF